MGALSPAVRDAVKRHMAGNGLVYFESMVCGNPQQKHLGISLLVRRLSRQNAQRAGWRSTGLLEHTA
jgi:hypothetical protein